MLIRFALLTAIISLLPSCGGLSLPSASAPPAPPYPPGTRPLLLALYHPYPDFRDLPPGVRPLPAYSGWPASRMERDLERLREVGFDGVLLAVSPQSLADNFLAKAVVTFQSLAAEQSPVFQVGLLLTPPAPMALREDNVVNYLNSHGMLSPNSVLQIDGKPFIGYSENISLTAAPQSGCSRRQLGREWPSLPRGATAPSPDSGLGAEGVCWVRAADRGIDGAWSEPARWPLTRQRAGALTEGLRRAFAAQAKIIIVSSWNHYQDGSFMEPNTFDQDLMFKAMQTELRRAGL